MRDPDLVAYLERALRVREWTQADFARHMGVSTGAVAMWMNRKRVPGPSSIDRIADVLHADTDSLLVLAGHRPTIPDVDPMSREAEVLGLVHRIDWEREGESIEVVVDMLQVLAKRLPKARKDGT